MSDGIPMKSTSLNTITDNLNVVTLSNKITVGDTNLIRLNVHVISLSIFSSPKYQFNQSYGLNWKPHTETSYPKRNMVP